MKKVHSPPAPERRRTSGLWFSQSQQTRRTTPLGRLRRDSRPLLAIVFSLVALATIGGGSAVAAGTSTIQGTVFKDLNRNGVQDAGEAPLASQELSLYDGGGQYLGDTSSDTAGVYRFSGLADGAYRVQFASPSWWAPCVVNVTTTTGSIFPRRSLSLAGSATADFGWRPIVRSTDLLAPISTYVGGNGLRVESFDDVVPAREIYDARHLHDAAGCGSASAAASDTGTHGGD